VMLSSAQLERLQVLWGEQGAPLAKHLQPGLTNEEIDSAMGSLGLRLPTEATLWWRWHNGVPSGSPRDMGGPALACLGLEAAVREYHSSRRVAEQAAMTDGEADRLWHPTWFPITNTGYGGVIACDCSVPEGSPTPIRRVAWGYNEESDVPVAESFGQMVGWWIDAIERGAWRYDTTLERWEIDHRQLANPALELTGLV
jgi:cell wall assembly regulator SMI1